MRKKIRCFCLLALTKDEVTRRRIRYMKKISAFLGIMILALSLFSCDSTVSKNSNNNNESSVNLESENEKKDNNEVAEDNSDVFTDIPDWLENLFSLKKDGKKLYFKGSGEKLSFEGDKVKIPECNIIMAAKEIAGYDLEEIEIQDDVIDILQSISNEKIINEQEVTKQEWLGINYYIVLLSTDAKYYLLDFDISTQDLLRISISAEDEYQSFFMKSSELCQKIKKNTQFKLFDKKNISEINRIEVVKSEKQRYELSNDELEKFKEILSNLNDKTDKSECPFDVVLVAETDKEELHLKWCNDSCRIIAVEGGYYRLTEQEAQWIQNLIKVEI